MTIDYVKAIAQNTRYQVNLGWSLKDISPYATAITSSFVDEVIAKQRTLSVMPFDGVCGAGTYSAILADRQNRLQMGLEPYTTMDPLQRAGMIAVCEIKRLWLRGLVDLPPLSSPAYEATRQAFAQLIQTKLGLNWHWIDIPEHTPSIHQVMEFCGSGVAYGHRAAGLHLDIREDLCASTYRLDCCFKYKPLDKRVPNKKPATGPYRMCIDLDEHSRAADAVFPDGTRPRAGDVALVGGVATGPGKHITTIESFDPTTGVCTTLECNGGGMLPNGTRGRGVVRAQRPIGLGNMQPTSYFVRRIGRFAPADYA